MRLDDVRTALDSSAEQVRRRDSDPTRRNHVRRRVRRRRGARMAALASAFVVATVAVVAVVDATGSTKPSRVVVAQSTTTVVKRPAPASSPEQLRAHDGIGVATDWAPVDAGEARVFVPQSWIDFSFSGCTRDVPSTGSVSIGEIALQHCDSASHLNNAPPTQAVALVPSTVKPTGPVVDVVHGYRVHAAPTAQLHPGWTVYDVPQLDLEIALQGSLQDQSPGHARAVGAGVALAFAAQPAPTGHVYAADGVRLTIPTPWPVADATSYPCFWPGTIPGDPGGTPAHHADRYILEIVRCSRLRTYGPFTMVCISSLVRKAAPRPRNRRPRRSRRFTMAKRRSGSTPSPATRPANSTCSSGGQARRSLT